MFEGPGLLWTLVAIFLGTLASEDLATISAGLLAAAGKIDYLAAVGASFGGILFGDTLIFLGGYYFGRPLLRHRWSRWLVSERAVDRAQRLVQRHGMWIILITRFIPGTRTATYFSAGALHAPPLRFIALFALAAALWTPFLVGLSMLIGNQLMELYSVYEALAFSVMLAAGLFLYLLIHYGLPLFTWKGRRRLRGKWMRATKWEFWPGWQVNGLVVLYVLWLGIARYRRPLAFAAVNPCMPHGGFLGESKSGILDSMSGVGDALPRWFRLPPAEPGQRMARLEAGMAEAGLQFPIVLKPDEGQRGFGVRVVRDAAAAVEWLTERPGPALLQEFVGGREYGVFYVRDPRDPQGRIISITIKQQLEVVGNGQDTLETLIHAHPRAIAQLDRFLSRFADRLDEVPPIGQGIPLGDIGNHAQGALFLDGRHLLTPELEAAMDGIARRIPGFHFGRFDIKVPDESSLQAGRDIRILEVNGLTSESTHIYDPQHGLLHAWGTLCRQWRIAFEIGLENARRGHAVPGVREFLGGYVTAARRQAAAARG